MRTPCILLTLLTLTLSPALATTWVVDAGGGGDFTTLQAAIDAVAPGDVLLVQPGIYDEFVLDKELTILGALAEQPRVFGISVVVADDAVLAGLQFTLLELHDAAGVIVLDDCFINANSVGLAGCWGALIVEGCAQVHVIRSTIEGRDGDWACEGQGLHVTDAHVTLTDCTVTGGEGGSEFMWGYDGQEGIVIEGDSTVLLAQTSVAGGHGGYPQGLSGPVGDGALAIWIEHATGRCIIRGNSSTLIQAGVGGDDTAWTPPVPVAGDGQLVLSGVVYEPPALPSGMKVTLPDPAEPFILLTGPDTPTASKQLELYGPVGGQLWILCAWQHALLELGAVVGPLYLDPATTVLDVALPTVGQEDSYLLRVRLPDSMIGVEGFQLVFQGFAPGMGADGTYLATNPAQLVLRR